MKSAKSALPKRRGIFRPRGTLPKTKRSKKADSQDDQENELRGALLLLLFNILVSILIPGILSVIKPGFLSDQEQIIFGLLGFCTASLLEILLSVKRISMNNLELMEIWEAREGADIQLQEIRRMYHAVKESSYGESDLFLRVVTRRIDELDRLLLEATTKGEIRIDQSMLQVTSEVLSSAFTGRTEDIFRAVYYCEDNEFMFGLHGKRYFRQVYDLVCAGTLKEVRRLIVYNTQAELDEIKTKSIISFHLGTPGYDCVLMQASDFNRILRDFQLSHIARDFGIYGDRYLYKAYVNVREDIVGSYSKNSSDITQFTDFFEACWVSPSAHKPTSDGPTLFRAQQTLLNQEAEPLLTLPIANTPKQSD